MQQEFRPITYKKKKYKSSFLDGLSAMLQDNNLQEIIAWSKDGQAFEILKPAEFTNTVLPKFYRHNNMNSFLKQLNMYNFQRQGAHKKVLVFVHPQFQRNQQDMIKKIDRRRVAQKQKDGESCSESQETKSEDDLSSKASKRVCKGPEEAESPIQSNLCKVECPSETERTDTSEKSQNSTKGNQLPLVMKENSILPIQQHLSALQPLLADFQKRTVVSPAPLSIFSMNQFNPLASFGFNGASLNPQNHSMGSLYWKMPIQALHNGSLVSALLRQFNNY
mmetsp:Transcript_12114/g.13923  ORF Transcript_12114/g.13923 Transcript_12114/m.13923 type:complete len:278 (+) Transcript_12114:3-836(+)